MSSYLDLFELIGVFARRRYRAGERGFAALGLNHTEARLLSLLDEEGGGATQERLSQQLLIDRSNAGRALKRLEQHRYVRRSRDGADRRTYQVHMTARGRDAVAAIDSLRKEIAGSFFGDLGETEAAKVVTLLRKALRADQSAT